MSKLKGKKKWLTLAVALALAALEVIAPALTPLGEVVADVIAPPPPGEESALREWEAAGVSRPSGS